MKKKIFLAVLLCGSLFGSNHYDSDDRANEQTSLVTNQILQNQVLNESLEQFLSEKIQKTSNKMAGYIGTQFLYSSNIKIYNIPFNVEFQNGFGLHLNLPYVDNSFYHHKGIGDMSLGVSYSFGSLEASSSLNKISFDLKTISGDQKKYLGSGAYSYTIGYSFRKNIYEDYNVFASANYTFNGTYKDNTLNTKYDYGNAYIAILGGRMPCLLSNKITTSAKLTYFHTDETNQKTFGFQNKYDKTSILDLWLQWDSKKLIANTPIGIGVKIPLVNKKDSNNIAKKAYFFFTASKLF